MNKYKVNNNKKRGYTTIELVFNVVFHILAVFLLLTILNACQSHIRLYKELYVLASAIRSEHQQLDPPEELTTDKCQEIANPLLKTEINRSGKIFLTGIKNIKGFEDGTLTCEVFPADKYLTLSFSSSYNDLFKGLFKSDVFSASTTIVYNGN